MKERSFAVASTFAAFLASLCCLGPVFLGGAGLGAVLAATFAPLRPYFLAVSAILLAGGFYFVYRKPRAAEACAGETCGPHSKAGRMAKPLLWLASVAVLTLAFFPTYGPMLARKRVEPAYNSTASLQALELKITGMSCEVCAAGIQRKLAATPGVVSAEVRYPAGNATIRFDSARTDIQKLVSVVKEAGYNAEPSGSIQR